MTDSAPKPSPANKALLDKARRIEAALTGLNTRIARLAMALGIELDAQSDIEYLLEHDPRLQLAAHDKRRHVQVQELRGLLVLRCELMTHMLQDYGREVTYQISEDVEEQMERHGFKHGADGFALLRLLEKAEAEAQKNSM